MPLATTGSHTKTVEVASTAPMRTHDRQSLSARRAADVALIFRFELVLCRRALGMVHLTLCGIEPRRPTSLR